MSLADEMLPIGVFGRPAVGRVAPSGRVSFVDGSPDLGWHVAADDRWYDPEREVAVRRSDTGGLPIVSTRMRVPGGDIVHRVWCASGPNARPIVVVDVENDSPMPVAVAFTRNDLSVSRPIAARGAEGTWPAPGLELAIAPTVMPVGHRARVRVAVGRGVDLERLADVDAVARGWSTMCEGSSRLVLPDLRSGTPLVDRVNRAKVGLALADDTEMPWRDADELSTWLIDRFHAQRLGARSTPAEEVAGAIERIVRQSRRGRMSSRRAAAVRVGAIWLSGRDEHTVGDIARIVRRKLGDELPTVLGGPRLDVDTASSDGEVITAVEESLVSWRGDDRLTLCPDGIVAERLGSSFEAHGLAVAFGARLSMAVRWHGPNAAVLWDIEASDEGPARPVELRCGADDQWSSNEARGEGLWRVTAAGTIVDGSESISFD
ncbi:MAG: hypothetical protein FJW09_05780 [Actinobacteria bacterium]|nr:hypothetical protein [Actinomycetota bacterium]